MTAPIPPGGIPNIGPINPTGAGSPVVGKGDAKGDFVSVVRKLINDANNQQHGAEKSVQNLIEGKSDNIQEVVTSMAKADLSFRFIMEIRNRLMDSYQELMRMQV